MQKALLGGVAIAALMAAMVAGADRAFAQADTQRLEAIEKDNAAMRLRIRRLEAENENAALRARLDRLDPQGESSRRAPPAGKEPGSIAEWSAATSGSGLHDYAADMDVKARRPALPSLYSWSGFYVGVNAGYSVGNDRETQTINTGAPIGQFLSSPADNVVVPKGVIGGAQVGYNWQGGPSWLAGLEADFQGSNQKDVACGLLCTVQTAPGASVTLATTINQHLSYFGTARARLGYTNNDLLFYVTGGGAFARINETDTFTAISTAPPPSAAISSGSVSADKFGWVVGGGIEGALWGNWTAKAEYLYMDLGTITSSFNGVVTTSPATVSTTSAIRDHIVRFGLNYRFGGGAAGSGAMAYAGGGMQDYAADAAAMPIRSQYAMPTLYSWTGPYVGVNLGYGSGNDRTTGTLSSPTTGGTLGPDGDSVAAPKGVLGGAQVGYNWQGGANWLVGFEADIQGSDQTDTVCTSPLCSNIINLVGPPTSIASTIEQDLKWFATFRARAGLVRNDFLLYVTGGAALAQITEIDTFAQNTGAGSIVSGSSQFTSDKAGWVVGVGAEAALWGNLTGKVEYLFLDLGNLSNSFNFNLAGTPATFSTTSTVRDHIFRAGLNYRFGEAAAPISTRY